MSDIKVSTGWLTQAASARGGVAAKQWLFTGFVLATSALLALSSSSLVFSQTYLTAAGALVVTTLLAAVAPWPRIPRAVIAVVPLADIAIIGVMSDVFRGAGSAVTLLAFLPALWLAHVFRHVGNAVAILAAFLAISLPTAVDAYPDINSVVVTRALLVPLIVGQVGFLVALGQSRLLAERGRTQAALREKDDLLGAAIAQERLLENIIDTIDIGVVVLDRDGQITRMNRAQRELYRLASPPGADSPGEKDLLLRIPNTRIPVPEQERPVARAIERETFSNYVVALGPASGEGRKISTSARQIIDVEGHHDGAVVVFADVTTYFDAARRQQRFVAAVSHELRTPLTSILGYLDLVLEGGGVSDGDAAHLEVVARNAEQLLSIVQDLLATQSVQDSGPEISRSSGDLSLLTQQAVESIRQEAAAKHLNIALNIQDTQAVSVDAPRMTQAITNLLSNAVKFTPERGGVTIGAHERHNAVEITVSDTGIGMSDEEQTNLFSQYYRTATAKQQHIPGHGLGLSITKLIVLAHEGQISVRSTQGAGSTFTIRIPVPDSRSVTSPPTRTL
ncbi:sensor histidine kinase [Brachybacterium sp. UNK5269]|uniref:sensor histidine kinase n=1 Tax=Brachybacterium sp. UNK5269 TaxID=3408576 RepID=UPI003BB169EA